jgi:predicted PurR-regulated permease PerM
MLVQRVDFRNRFLQLVGSGNLIVLTAASNEAAQGISQYLVTQLIVNSAFGAVLGARLFVIGVPNASFGGTACLDSSFRTLRWIVLVCSVLVHYFTRCI